MSSLLWGGKLKTKKNNQPTLLVSLFLSASHFPFLTKPFAFKLFCLPVIQTALWIRRTCRPSSLSLSNRRSLRTKTVELQWGEKAGHKAAYTYSSSSFFPYSRRFRLCTWTHSQHAHVHFFVFSLFVFFPFISRYLYTDPLHCNMTYLLLRLLKDDLKEYAYAARLAGLVYGIASGMNAILVSKAVWSLGGGERGRHRGLCREALAECGGCSGFLGEDLHKSLLDAAAAFAANTKSICHRGKVESFQGLSLERNSRVSADVSNRSDKVEMRFRNVQMLPLVSH